VGVISLFTPLQADIARLLQTQACHHLHDHSGHNSLIFVEFHQDMIEAGGMGDIIPEQQLQVGVCVCCGSLRVCSCSSTGNT
jgi:hypothetical protein